MTEANKRTRHQKPKDRGSFTARLTGFAFLSPALIGLIVFVLVPMAYALGLSFYRWDLIRPNARFIGLDNYTETLAAPAFWNALRITAIYTLGTVPLSMALGLGLATLLNRRLPGRDLLRTLAFLPSITSIIAVSVVWAWLLHPDFGLLNALLNTFGIGSRRWLSSSTDALPALMLVSVWRRVGHDMVIYLAGLQGIAGDYLEAAAIDGANGWQRFRYITWPLLAPITLFITVVGVIDSFQVFGTVETLTQGGPVGSTTTLMYYLYEVAFVRFQMGRASAIAFVLFAILMGLTALQLRLGRERARYA